MKTMRKLISIVLTLALCTSLAAPALALSFDDVQEAIEWEREERDDRDDAAEDEDDKSEDSNTNEGDDADDDKSDESTANEGDDADDDKSDETEANADVNEDEEPEEPEDEEPVQETADGSLILGTDDRYGFKWNKDSSKFGIEAWDTETEDEEGNKTTVRNIKLNEDVKHDDDKDRNSIVVNEDKNVNLDLNGNDIDGGKRETNSALIEVKGGDLTIQDSTAKVDEDGKYVSGEITGANNSGFGGGVAVTDGGSLTLESGTIKDNVGGLNGGGVYVGNGKFTMEDGLIDNNSVKNFGGGVYVNTELASWQNGEAQFVMNGGTISNNRADNGNGSGGGGGVASQSQAKPTPEYTAIEINGGNITNNHAASQGGGIHTNDKATIGGGATISGNTSVSGGGMFISGSGNVTIDSSTVKDNEATGYGGGIYATNQSQVTMNSGTITGNEAGNGGAGIFATSTSKVTMNGGTITGNTAAIDGGGIYTYGKAEFIMNDGTITGNHAGNGGGGILVYGTSTFIMKDGVLYQNTAAKHSDDAYKGKGAILILPVASSMGVSGSDGKTISGWYQDSSGRWGNIYTNRDDAVNAETNEAYVNQTLWLKAAHDEYFKVTFTDGVDGSVFGNRTKEAENNTGIPAFGESYDEVPTREGYVFVGWLLDDEDVDLENGIVNGEMTLVAQWEAIPQEPDVDPEEPDVPDTPIVDPDEPDVPDTPVVDPEEPEVPDIEDEDVPLTGEPDDDDDDDDDGEPVEAEDVEIEDELVPLAAGPVTRAEFVDYLWQHEGEPAPVADSGLFADVTAEHEYSPAIAWAKSINIIEGYEDDTFAPDELVTVAAVRSILTRFAAYAGMDVDVSALVSLTGEDDAVVMNCDAVLAEFFGEETEA